MYALALALLLLTPEQSHVMKYRFKKGMVYESTSSTEVKLRLFGDDGRIFKNHMTMDQVLERTVMEIDGKSQPTVERIVVKKWTANFIAWPDREPGKKNNAAQGQTFVWRQKRDKSWGLFDAKQEVTEVHPGLVEKLQPWRDARVPKKSVKVGEKWEVDAATFLSAAGMQVPPGVDGRATFVIEKVKDDVAWISFNLKMAYSDDGRMITGVQRGVWKFDLKNGRDLSMRVDGETEVNNGRSGFGTVKLKRTIAYR